MQAAHSLVVPGVPAHRADDLEKYLLRVLGFRVSVVDDNAWLTGRGGSETPLVRERMQQIADALGGRLVAGVNVRFDRARVFPGVARVPVPKSAR